jgi:hypothetical protein
MDRMTITIIYLTIIATLFKRASMPMKVGTSSSIRTVSSSSYRTRNCQTLHRRELKISTSWRDSMQRSNRKSRMTGHCLWKLKGSQRPTSAMRRDVQTCRKWSTANKKMQSLSCIEGCHRNAKSRYPESLPCTDSSQGREASFLCQQSTSWGLIARILTKTLPDRPLVLQIPTSRGKVE